MSSTVVVGYDRSTPSEQALLVAGREASVRHADLTVVHAYPYPRPAAPILFPLVALQQVYDKAGAEVADEGAQRVRARYPDLRIRAEAVVGSAAQVLVDAARDAEVLVVGNRGRGGFAGLLLGSVSMRVLGGASCPVIIARGESGDPHGRVVAAVDVDDPGSAEVLAFAFDEAAGRRAELVAVHVWDDDQRLVMEQNLAVAGLLKSAKEIAADLDECLAALLSRAHAAYPEVEASSRVVAGTAATKLVEESEHADLVVAGAHRRHGGHGGHDGHDRHDGHDEHPGMRVGPVATTLAHHARCPVAVVPHG